MKTDIYQRQRDFVVCGVVGVCATTKRDFVREVFSMPTSPISATVDLVGVPAVISAKENPEYAEMYNKSTMAAIDGMPIVYIGRKKGIQCERCAAPDIWGLFLKKASGRGKPITFMAEKMMRCYKNCVLIWKKVTLAFKLSECIPRLFAH